MLIFFYSQTYFSINDKLQSDGLTKLISSPFLINQFDLLLQNIPF